LACFLIHFVIKIPGLAKKEIPMKRKMVLFGLSMILTIALTILPSFGQDKDGVYVIKKGDTLWDLSGKYLNSPYMWPELWQRNPYITNPHWIYPGNSLQLYGAPRTARPSAGAGEKPVKKAQPTKEIIKAPEGETGGFILLEGEALGTIVDARYEKYLLAEGDVVYVALKNRSAKAGEQFTVFREEGVLTDPYTQKTHTKIRILGVLRILDYKGQFYRAELINTNDAVLRGDELMARKPMPWDL
jgi:hypothetical protein